MNLKRMALINKAFEKLDSNGNGVVTMKDLDGVYNYLKNPHFLAGEKTKEQIFGEFLTAFELSGHVDGRVRIKYESSTSRISYQIGRS